MKKIIENIKGFVAKVMDTAIKGVKKIVSLTVEYPITAISHLLSGII